MAGVIKIWKHTTIKGERRLSIRDASKYRSDTARIGRAMRLLRKGAISRAGKALESNGSGDLQDPAILRRMEAKHPVRVKQIGPDMYTFVPEEEVQLKMGKILGKLKNEASHGPCRLMNNHVRMWMGLFAPATTDTAIENLEDLITDMANDKLSPWFMQAMQGAELLAIVKEESR
jgi:hypothetical protein